MAKKKSQTSEESPRQTGSQENFWTAFAIAAADYDVNLLMLHMMLQASYVWSTWCDLWADSISRSKSDTNQMFLWTRPQSKKMRVGWALQDFLAFYSEYLCALDETLKFQCVYSVCVCVCVCVCVDLDSLLCCIGYWSKFFSKRRTVQNHCLLVMWAWWKKRTWEPTCSVRSFTIFSQNHSLQYIISSVFLNSMCHCLSKTKFINNFFFKLDRREVLSSVCLLFSMIKTMQASTISMSTEWGKNWSGTYWLVFKIQAHICGSLPLNSWRKLAYSMCFITNPTEYLRDC